MQYIAWPSIVLILGIVFVLVFRKPIERLLDRTSKISPSGLETKPSDVSAAAAQETSITRNISGMEELLSPFENSILVEQEELIRKELRDRQVNEPPDREKVLIRYLASAYIVSRFERAYYFIFGSQLQLLQDLNSSGSLHKDMIRAISYDVAVIGSPDFYSDYSFDQWLYFLESHTLLRVDGDSVTITIAGREFLKWLIQEGRPFYKPR